MRNGPSSVSTHNQHIDYVFFLNIVCRILALIHGIYFYSLTLTGDTFNNIGIWLCVSFRDTI